VNKLADRVKVAISTAGTGTLTFGAVLSNAFMTPAEAGYVAGDKAPYILIEGTSVERGAGIVGASSLTLSRSVRSSKIGGVVSTSPIDLTGTGAVLFFTPQSEDLMFAETHGADISSAGTLDLQSATGMLVDVTGTTGISGVTLNNGQERWVRFTGAVVITVGASLVGNGGGSNITTAAGDIAVFRGYAAGVVRFWLIRASGKAVVLPSSNDITDATATGKALIVATDAAAGRSAINAAPVDSPTFTGTPAAPTPTVDDSTTKIATTGFVLGQASAAGDGTPAMDGTAGRGTSTHFARADHVHPTDTSLIPVSYLDTNTGLAANSDSKIATQKAVKAYVDALAAVVSGALVFKAAWDASAGTFPGGGTAQIGYFYKVSVAGTVNGVLFTVGDDIYAVANNASTTTYANNWLKIEGSITTAEVLAAIGSSAVPLATALETARTIDGVSFNGTANITVIAPATDAATSKSTPVDADKIPLVDSAASNVLKGLTWANLKATLKTYLDTLYCALATEDQVVTGGARVTSKSLGTITTGTLTLDTGDRPLQHYTNNGAHTLAPGTNTGSFYLDITNGASAGAITTTGFTKVVGDAFTTTNGNKFRCGVSIGDTGSLLQVQAMQ
jgi:hypothetical protein